MAEAGRGQSPRAVHLVVRMAIDGTSGLPISTSDVEMDTVKSVRGARRDLDQTCAEVLGVEGGRNGRRHGRELR